MLNAGMLMIYNCLAVSLLSHGDDHIESYVTGGN